ncbi:MAG: hypothetical protein HDR37_12750 [Treponema sp.]|nr:hypothetical protein [Treponema sp.]
MKSKEIVKLKRMLENNDEVSVDFIFSERVNGYHLYSKDFSSFTWKGWSVVEDDNSYGANKDLLEIAGEILTEKERSRGGFDVVGGISAEEAYRRIIEYEKGRSV